MSVGIGDDLDANETARTQLGAVTNGERDLDRTGIDIDAWSDTLDHGLGDQVERIRTQSNGLSHGQSGDVPFGNADVGVQRVKVGKIDTDANRDVSVRFSISAIPTVMLFHKGEVVDKFVGLRAKKDLQAALDLLTS